MRKRLHFFTVTALMTLFHSALLAQNKTVTGLVTAGNNIPVQGVTISVKDSPRATTTDANGKFTISVFDNTSLIVSVAGYKTQTINTAGASDLQIKLVADVSRLDEVVVTGLATSVKRRDLPNAVTVIGAKELNGIAPAQTLDAALEGKIPGANIIANSGAPGGGVSVKLRGVTSVFGNTQPLYVIDGVYVDNTATSGGLNAVTLASPGSPTSNQDNPSSRIADIRPEDIENIEILKGASAAAIYGSRAAGGVIIITTKKGKPGRTNITFSQDIGFLSPIKLLGVRQFTAETAATLPGDSATLVNAFLEAQSKGEIYNYEKEVYDHTALTSNTEVSMRGGSEKTDFYFSAGYEDDGGIVEGTGYSNTSVRLNLNHKITYGIKI
jgi:TonB-dependent SusC/RagA subfamily outer membrane receptor